MSRSASQMVIDHELIDLSDEATLRAWEIFETIAETQRFLFELVEEPKAIAEIRSWKGTDELIEETNYTSLLRLSIDGPTGEEELYSNLPSQMPEDWQKTAQRLRPHLRGPLAVAVSEIQSAGGLPFVCICMRKDEDTILSALVQLGGNRNDPRHLMLIAGETEAVDFFMHLPMEDGDDTFWNEGNFRRVIREMWATEAKKAQEAAATDPPPPGTPPILTPRLPNIERIQLLREIPLEAPHFYFIEGEVGEALAKRLDEKEEEIPIDELFADIQEEHGARIGGLANSVKDVRVLAKSRRSLEAAKKAINERLKNHELLTDVYHGIDWRRPVPCKTADIQVNRFALQTANGTRNYLLLYAAFREELAANVFEEVRELMKFAIPFALVAGSLAFLVTFLFVRPLEKITRTAQSVTDSPNEALLEKVDTMVKSLPVERIDEAGDIARALRRLFNEIWASHRQLDRRVDERTQELKEANAELRTLDEAKDTFVANVSHELRNPLGVVSQSFQSLNWTDLDEEQDEYVRRGRRAERTLLALINDLLAYQEIVLGGVDLKPAEIDLPAFLHDLREDMETAAKKNSNTLVFEHSPDIGSIAADNLRLRQILANLVGNACKFTNEGTITLESRRVADMVGSWIEFRVTDTGRGMTPDEQAKIFSLFYTNKEANQTGTGLGLPISQKLSNLMGGDIRLEASELGKGSTFLVRIPALQSDKLPPPVRDGNGESPLILVIDDEKNVREVMKQQLTSQGYDVVEAASGEEGIDRAIQLQPAAITLDAVMPEVDGWDVLARLKANPRTASIPVVMVTFLNREAKGFALGADDYFTKPVDWDRLSHVLENLTDGSSPRRILVVEDDESARTFLTKAFKREGWTVNEATHGRAALDSMEQSLPDAIVLDLMMPVMNGFEFLAEVRKREDWEQIPIIVVTAKVTTRDEHAILEHSVERVLQKGAFSYDELFGIIRQRLDRHQLSRPS